MKFPLSTAITTILVLFSSSCSAAPAGTTDVILKDVQDIYSQLQTFREGFQRLRAGNENALYTLQEDMDKIFLAFSDVNANINTQLGIPNASTDRYGKEGGIDEDEYYKVSK